jgi:hypothetical protein
MDAQRFHPTPEKGAIKTACAMAKKPGPKPQPDRARSATVTFKCRPEYKAWLAKFARSERDIPPRLIDLGLIELAKKRGFELPPER